MMPLMNEATLQRQRAICNLGEIWLARAPAGISALLLGRDRAQLQREWERRFSSQAVQDSAPDEALERIVAYLQGDRVDLNALPLAVGGTPFQQRVWAALRRIPYGETRSYRALAEELADQKAARAVGSACARNPVALLIPCHRAIRSDGGLGGFAWGIETKRALLQLEAKGALPTNAADGQLSFLL